MRLCPPHFSHMSIEKRPIAFSSFPSQQPLVDWQTIFWHMYSLRWMSFHLYCYCCKKEGDFQRTVYFLMFYLSALTWDQLQERKQESSRVVVEAPPKTNQTPLSFQKERYLQTCSYPIHFLCSCSVFLRWLICCWLLEFRVTFSLTCGGSVVCPQWLDRKQFDLLMRPLPSPCQLKCDGLLHGCHRQTLVIKKKHHLICNCIYKNSCLVCFNCI